MKIYLASAYSNMEWMRRIAQRLTDAGFEVTSRWIEGNHDTPPAGVEPSSPEHLRWCAEDDIADIERADCVVSVTGGGNRSRGGRHVEFGYALARGKSLVILGERENVFHHLRGIHQYGDLTVLIAALQAEDDRRGRAIAQERLAALHRRAS